LYHIHPPSPFLHLLPSPSGTKPQAESVLLSDSQILYKKRKREKWDFWLFKIAMQGVSLWHFHVYMYCDPVWFISSIFLLTLLVPFLWWFQLV
jgi:hypothetical protein